MMWVLFLMIPVMGFVLIRVRRQRKTRETRGSQAKAA
jgi:hypothetical protein